MADASARYFTGKEAGWYVAVAAATLALQRGFVQQLGAELVVLLGLAGMAHLIYERQQHALRPARRVSSSRRPDGNGALLVGSVVFFGIVAAVLQAAPVWMPDAGMFVALAAVAPVFFAFKRDSHIGALAVLGAAALLSTISLGATNWFLLTTVPVGAGLGWAFSQANARQALYQVAAALFVGMICLSYVAGIPALHGWAEAQGQLESLLIYACAAFLYTLVWATVLTQLHERTPQRDNSAPVRRIA